MNHKERRSYQRGDVQFSYFVGAAVSGDKPLGIPVGVVHWSGMEEHVRGRRNQKASMLAERPCR